MCERWVCGCVCVCVCVCELCVKFDWDSTLLFKNLTQTF